MVLPIKNFINKFQGFLELKGSTLALKCFTLENITLVLALKFKVFQGQLELSLEIYNLPSALETLDISRKGNLDLEKTLKFNFNFKES